MTVSSKDIEYVQTRKWKSIECNWESKDCQTIYIADQSDVERVVKTLEALGFKHEDGLEGEKAPEGTDFRTFPAEEDGVPQTEIWLTSKIAEDFLIRGEIQKSQLSGMLEQRNRKIEQNRPT